MSTGVIYTYTLKKYVKKSIIPPFTVAIVIGYNVFCVFCITSCNKCIFVDGDQAQVDMEASHQELEEVEAKIEDADGGQSPPQRLTRSMFKALGANIRLISLFVISLFEGA